MAPEVIIERATVIVAVGLLAAGVLSAWTNANIAKRIAGLTAAFLGALLALGALRAPQALSIGAAAVMFGYVALGVALLVRMRETYGSIETPEIDEADAQSELLESKS